MQTRHQRRKAAQYPTILTIAASDSIAGAGIQADVRACSAFGVYAMTALTAVTVQDTTGVKRVHPLTPRLVSEQLQTVCSDIIPGAIKIGMIPNAAVATAIADFLDSSESIPIVLDTVLAPTSGKKAFASGNTLDIILTRILPHVSLMTPNIPESQKIAFALRCDPTADALAEAAGCDVLLKGGHGDLNDLNDVYATPDGFSCGFSHSRVDTPNTHGTGCALSSAIAANIALGHSTLHSIGKAISWMQDQMYKNRHIRLGHGHGPTIF